MGQVAVDLTDIGLTSIWHCKTSCKTWCATAQCVQEAVVPVSTLHLSNDFWKRLRRNETHPARKHRHHCVALISKLMSELMIKQPRLRIYRRLQFEKGCVLFFVFFVLTTSQEDKKTGLYVVSKNSAGQMSVKKTLSSLLSLFTSYSLRTHRARKLSIRFPKGK